MNTVRQIQSNGSYQAAQEKAPAQTLTENNSKIKVSEGKISTNGQIPINQKVKEEPGYQPTLSEKNILKAIEQANKKLSGVQTEFKFAVHEQTKQIMVKVINQETKEIIREIPPEKTLDMVAKMWELAGLFVDEKR